MTPLLDIQNLTKRIGDRVLLDNISFTVFERQHLALIAKNGTGKSTLLSVIADEDGYEEGNIVAKNGLRIGYLRQLPTYLENMTVVEACFSHGNELTTLIKEYEECLATPGMPRLDELVGRMDLTNAWDYENTIKQILSKLKITDFNQKIGHLSGGQIKRIALANILIAEPDMLILDEPTNHLDLEMIEWLEKYLKDSTKAILMVTHDRYFLDRVCDSILEIDNSQLFFYKGNYSYYLEKRQERIDAANQEIQRANNLYRTELEWMRATPQARSHKAKYREDAFYELEKVAKRRVDNSKVKIVQKDNYIGSKIFVAKNVFKAFGDKVILKDFNYTFSRYERLGIIGNNGTGKSTFIKLLLGLEPLDKGHFDIGETVRFGYYSQQGLEFDPSEKVIDAVRKIAEYVDLGGGQKLTASQFLQHFLFTPETQHNYIAKLSGGERRRLYLCTVLMKNPNFLILDEPTNDLDIVTLQILEEYLIGFKGCLIIVSHDRYFMDKVVDHIFVFSGDGNVDDFPGGYTLYREKQEAERLAERKSEKKDNTAKPQVQKTHERKLTFKEKKEMEQLEEDIENLEAEKANIEKELSSGQISVDRITELSKRLPVVNEMLDDKSMRWLELSEI